MKTALKATSVALASSLALSACVMSDMSEMHDNTLEMNQKMSATNSGVDATNTAVTATYLDLRKKDTASERNESINMMQDAKEMGPKLAHASSFMAAMEFQVFEPKIESQAARDILFNEGVRQFFRVMKEYITDRDDVSPKSTNERMENLYAMAAALHYVNSRQEIALQGTAHPVLSMLDLLTSALQQGRMVREGRLSTSQLPKYATEVLRNEQDAVYILRVRQNFLTAFGFAMSAGPANGDDMNLLQKGWFLVGHGALGIDWTPVIGDRNTVQIQYYDLILNYALATRDALSSNGYDPKIDRSITRILKNIDWRGVETQAPADGREGLPARERREAIQSLKATIAKIVG